MAMFRAIKIHYDRRESLPSYLKYSRVPTRREYDQYLHQYEADGVGGNGFHECLNFSMRDESVKIYLPPNYFPAERDREEEFVFFYFTYLHDPVLPSNIIGVHAGAKMVIPEGEDWTARRDVEPIQGIGQFHYCAEAARELATLFTPSIPYDFKAGRHTPRYQAWGNGIRNLEEHHAKKILSDAIAGATERLPNPNVPEPEKIVIEREISILKAIYAKYFGDDLNVTNGQVIARAFPGGQPPIPDREIGYLGEKYVYEKELAFAYVNGIPLDRVVWVSQVEPTSPFDIKSVRVRDGVEQDHYIEVKSSCVTGDSNIYISSRQTKFFEENQANATFRFINFASRGKIENDRELSYAQMQENFDLVPIKFKLKKRK